MQEIKLIIAIKIDEVPTFAQTVINSINTNLPDFTNYKPTKYAPAFFTALAAKQIEVKNIVYPIILTSELKIITYRLYTNVEGLRETMNLLEGYVVDAEDLSVLVDDFGIKDVRAKIASMDVEGLNEALSVVITNITTNFTELEHVDYTAAMKTALMDMRDSIFEDNTNQTKKMEERANLVVQNIGVINDLLSDVKGILDDGKRLYRINNKEKLKFFTISKIISELRKDELHTNISGTVTDADGKPLSKVKVVARPDIFGKRGKTTYTNPFGFYELKGMKPTSYLLAFTTRDGKTSMVKTEAITNKKVVVDFKGGE